MKEAPIIDNNGFRNVQFLLQHATSPCITITDSSHNTCFCQVIKQFNPFGSSSPVHLCPPHTQAHTQLCKQQQCYTELTSVPQWCLKDKHIFYTVVVSGEGEGRHSSSFFWCFFFSKADPASRRIEHMLMIQCSFFSPPPFFFHLQKKGHTLSWFRPQQAPLQNTTITFTARSNPKACVSWDVLFITLEHRFCVFVTALLTF